MIKRAGQACEQGVGEAETGGARDVQRARAQPSWVV